MLPAAIFDMDGLMFDTEKLWSDALDKVALRYGYEPNPAFNLACRGRAGEALMENVREFYPDAPGKTFWYESMEIVRDAVREHVPVKKGLYEILDMFRKNGVKLAVASGSPLALITNDLRVTGLTDYFDAVVSSDELKEEIRSKPAPDIFLRTAQELGFPPAQCYVFEDSFNGIRAAAAAGTCPIMIPDLNAPDEEMRRLTFAIYGDLAEAAENLYHIKALR